MRIKKFFGRSFKEALEAVKKELGADAVILSSKTIKQGQHGLLSREAVEVTAALDENADELPHRHEISSEGSFSLSEDILKELRSLREEVSFLKETLRPVVPSLRISRDKKGLYTRLIKQGVDSQFAVILVERSGDTIGSLMSAIKHEIKINRIVPSEEKGYMFFGPPGVGKTTTMSKMAHMLSAHKRPVCLISLDTQRISSIAYMKELARQVKCDLKLVKHVGELPKIIYKESERGPVLIDSPGRDFDAVLSQTKQVFSSGFPLSKCFLMDASTEMPSSVKLWQKAQPYDIDTIGFTRLDLAAQYGNLCNMSMLTGRPVAFLADGPDVPGDIKIPTPDYVAGLIAGGVCEN
ncbi:MAG TPA: AAA family ATPase [Dissulfurispiraceae bacterium]|nr:AAA family ATPase [Dissulfurispiraceae bacterium]